MNQSRGTVLISVLWIVLILTVISFSLAASVRVEMSSVQNTFDTERAELLAKGGALLLYRNVATHKDFAQDSPVRNENGQYVFQLNSGKVRVWFDSYASRIDINGASEDLLGAVLERLEVSPQQRAVIVDSILDWRDIDDDRRLNGAESADYNLFQQPIPGIKRPRNGPFRSVDELLYVNGVNQNVFYGGLVRDPSSGEYRRVPGLRDVLTVDSGLGTVDPNFAPAVVLRVLSAIDPAAADHILAERSIKPFQSLSDLTARVPELALSNALKYLAITPDLVTIIRSQGTLFSSGISRTVRLLMRKQTKPATEGVPPESFLQFVRWQYE
jgi:general secretion pathway protein K